MRTAQNVAAELGISRSEVYNLLRKKRFSPLVEKKGGQVSINNTLFNLLKEEIDYKRSFKKVEENETINTSDIEKIETKEKEDFKFNPIEVLKNQIDLKDNQITILNNIITNNLKRISELEEKRQEYKNLSEELKTLKTTLNNLTNKKSKKRVFGLF